MSPSVGRSVGLGVVVAVIRDTERRCGSSLSYSDWNDLELVCSRIVMALAVLLSQRRSKISGCLLIQASPGM